MDENAVAGVIDGRGRPLFVLALTPAVIKSQSGVFVVALNSYWYTYQASAATEDAMGHGDTSKLSAHSAKQRKPLDVLQQSIDLYLK